MRREIILIVLLNMAALPLSEYLTASCLAMKLFFYALYHHYGFETMRGEAAPHQVS